MASLIETNPYLKNAKLRKKWSEENAYASSIVEGARGLKAPQAGKRRSKASMKKPVKGA
jgi:hypothetical protein